MEHTIQLPQSLYEAIRQRAAAQHKTPDSLAIEMLAGQIEPLPTNDKTAAFEREIAAFERLKPTLLKEYPGQYVAIYQEKVVAHDDNKLETAQQVREQYGPVIYYVEQLLPDTPRTVRITSSWVTPS